MSEPPERGTRSHTNPEPRHPVAVTPAVRESVRGGVAVWTPCIMVDGPTGSTMHASKSVAMCEREHAEDYAADWAAKFIAGTRTAWDTPADPTNPPIYAADVRNDPAREYARLDSPGVVAVASELPGCWSVKGIPGQVTVDTYGPDAERIALAIAVAWNAGTLTP